MPTKFDQKTFNPEVFTAYLERVPRVKQNKLLEAGILRELSEFKNMFAEQGGGNYATVPMYGLIGGDPQNYDGMTDIVPETDGSFDRSVIVVGRMKAWKENDFANDITGADFMGNVASQVAEYWDGVDQDTIISELKGIFSKNDAFTVKHTFDCTSSENKNVTPTTLNSAIQKACGDNKGIFTVVICHSTVATNLENISAVEYLKYTDPQGVQRDLGLATWNGRLILVDDSLPVVSTKVSDGVAGVYTLTPGAGSAAGDKIVFDGAEYTLSANDTATAVVTELKTLLATQYGATFDISGKATLTLTQKVNGTGAIPSVTVGSSNTTLTSATIVETTAGAAATYENDYISFALGAGAFGFLDCGCTTPAEMERDAKKNGGETALITRQRKIYAPYGFSFKKTSMLSQSPTNAELENPLNWDIVNDGNGNTIDLKAIPIARIISRG